MVTAANGAEASYGYSTNATRSESLEESRALDTRIRAAWVGHPRLFTVDNSTDFAGKMQRVMQVLYRLVGQPAAPGDIIRKYLVELNFAGINSIARGTQTESLRALFAHYGISFEEYDNEHIFLLRGLGKDVAKEGANGTVFSR
jgi:hypothetical protein